MHITRVAMRLFVTVSSGFLFIGCQNSDSPKQETPPPAPADTPAPRADDKQPNADLSAAPRESTSTDPDEGRPMRVPQKISPSEAASTGIGAAVRQIPEEIEVNGVAYRLETYLWRDFMPPSPPDGKPLAVTIKLVRADRGEVDASIQLTRLWVHHAEGEWETPFSEEDRPSDPHAIERVARDGPKWPPGDKVEVVVEVVGPDEKTQRLRAAGQTIQRTS